MGVCTTENCTIVRQKKYGTETHRGWCTCYYQDRDLKARINRLETRLNIAIRALEFYAERTVYYKFSKFPGDQGELECSDLAEDALKQIRSEDDT
jgi:hypothetical protein